MGHIDQVLRESPLLLGTGFKKISNDRNCYSSMLFTNDAGFIVLNQMCVPGGKKIKLSKANVTQLREHGLHIGQEKDNFVVCPERTAWWADRAERELGRFVIFLCKML